MEDRVVNINRVGINALYPCNFITIATMNPCPCGYYGSKIKECICTEKQRENYRSKLSGPMLDRFDIHIQVNSVNTEEIHERTVETSSKIKERVELAKKCQLERYKNFSIYSNSELTPKLVEKFCVLNTETQTVLDNSFKKLNFSARAYFKIIKLARTIADLEGKKDIEKEHILEAIQYRNFDKIR